jgi:hypothetical protein
LQIRMLAMLAIAGLAVSSLHAAGADLQLSPGFATYAAEYLHTTRDCSYRVLSNNPIPCDYEDISEKVRSVATAPADTQVADNLDSWIVALVLYSRMASDEKADPQKLAQGLSAIKHMTDVCSAELGKALQDKNAPEKSECSDVLKPLVAP